MAQRSRPTISKRQREQARIAKQKDRAARRAEEATRPKSETPGASTPDISRIFVRDRSRSPSWQVGRGIGPESDLTRDLALAPARLPVDSG